MVGLNRESKKKILIFLIESGQCPSDSGVIIWNVFSNLIKLTYNKRDINLNKSEKYFRVGKVKRGDVQDSFYHQKTKILCTKNHKKLVS